jgi:hypothetical protein
VDGPVGGPSGDDEDDRSWLRRGRRWLRGAPGLIDPR